MHTWPLLRNLPATAAFATTSGIGVRQDDERRVPAEFETEPDDAVGGFSDQLLAHGRRAGEAHLAHGRMGERLSENSSRRRDHEVGDARRQAGFFETLKDLNQRQGSLVGRLDDDRCSRPRAPARSCALAT